MLCVLLDVDLVPLPALQSPLSS